MSRNHARIDRIGNCIAKSVSIGGAALALTGHAEAALRDAHPPCDNRGAAVCFSPDAGSAGTIANRHMWIAPIPHSPVEPIDERDQVEPF